MRRQDNISGVLENLPAGACLLAAQRGLLSCDPGGAPPENSLAAIDSSANAGADFFETDIQRTRDGAFVLVHDEDIGRELNGSGKVWSQTLSALKSLHKKNAGGGLSSERIATVDEALERAKGRIFIRADVRPHTLPYFCELWNLIKKKSMRGSVMFRVPREDIETTLRYTPTEAVAHPTVLLFQVDSMEEYRRIRAAQPNGRCIEVAITNPGRFDTRRVGLVRELSQLGEAVSSHVWDKASLETLRDAGARIFQTDIFEELSAHLKTIHFNHGFHRQ
jgi:hypothetical protein